MVSEGNFPLPVIKSSFTQILDLSMISLFLITEGFCWSWSFTVVDLLNLSVSWWTTVEYGALDWLREKKKIRCTCERSVSMKISTAWTISFDRLWNLKLWSSLSYVKRALIYKQQWLRRNHASLKKKNSSANIGNNSELLWVLIFPLLTPRDNEAKFRLRAHEQLRIMVQQRRKIPI